MRRIYLASIVLLAFCFFGAPLRADETDNTPPPAAENTTEKQTARDKALDRELEESLLPDEAQPSPGEVLDRAVNQMRNVSQRIESGEAGQETQQLQQQVLDDLTRLIELLKNQPPPPPPNPNNQPPPKDNQQQQNQQNQQQNQQQQKQQQQDQQQQSETERQPADGKNSEERLDEAREAQERAAARERMFKDIWGHLPEAVRNRLLNNFSEEYLPKYAPEVRRYFEELGQRRRDAQDR